VYLNNAGHNATVYSLTSGYSDRLSTIFQKLHESDSKSMLFDNTWSPAANKVGIGSLTFGNRLQIEAEYQLLTSISGVKNGTGSLGIIQTVGLGIKSHHVIHHFYVIV
jgi:hypothetical protein